MKTRILVLKHQLTVKYPIVWPREQLLVEKEKQTKKQQQQQQQPTLLGAAGKRPRKAIPPQRKLPPFGPPPPSLRISVALRGEGMAIFWNCTIHVLFTSKIWVMKS